MFPCKQGPPFNFHWNFTNSFHVTVIHARLENWTWASHYQTATMYDVHPTVLLFLLTMTGREVRVSKNESVLLLPRIYDPTTTKSTNRTISNKMYRSSDELWGWLERHLINLHCHQQLMAACSSFTISHLDKNPLETTTLNAHLIIISLLIIGLMSTNCE